MNNPIKRLITWLWDSTGRQREEQQARISGTEQAIEKNVVVRKAALKEIRRTQKYIERQTL